MFTVPMGRSRDHRCKRVREAGALKRKKGSVSDRDAPLFDSVYEKALAFLFDPYGDKSKVAALIYKQEDCAPSGLTGFLDLGRDFGR